jgi:uncharacterized protein YqhQ
MSKARESAEILINTEEVLVGGQAVIEGVMMRTPLTYSVAVRRADGGIEIKKDVVTRISGAWKFLKLPVVRGFAVLIQSLKLGYQALQFSFDVAVDGLNGQSQTESSENGSAPAKAKDNTLAMIAMFGVAMALGIGLFILLPLYLTTLLKGYFAALNNWVVFNLVDGLFRVAFFLAYLMATVMMRDIKRVFQYHGAEHKVVFTWEAKEALTVENARRHSRFHPRCGTSFLLFVMVTSILVFSLFKFKAFYLLFLSRVVLIPLISGLAYELIRFSAKKSFPTDGRPGSRFFRALTLPGLWLQRLTTQEPSDDQLEVAICALKEALDLEHHQKKELQEALVTS